MDAVKRNSKRDVFVKAWERCRSLGAIGSKKCSGNNGSLTRSKSWDCNTTKTTGEEGSNRLKKTSQVAPEGCFPVYVGPEKQMFVVRTEFVNHPLFRMLLEDAESEYGFNSEGPLLLPCDVDMFYRVLTEMDSSDNCEEISTNNPICSPFVLCGPCRPSNRGMNKGYGA